jgi:hypothetical protein
MFSKYPDYLICCYKVARLSVMLMIAIAITIVMLANPARATDQPDYDDPAFGAAVRGWLFANPEVLLEMAAKLDEIRAAQAAAGDSHLIAEHQAALFADNRDGRIGDGPPAFVEFIDYNCGNARWP